jgi:glycosyltransferase involved in cell wall biosynthesis
MTKLVIQIPCFNEAETIGTTVDALPKLVPGIDEIAVLIIDDGSTDNTVAVAKRHGVGHSISLPRNQGLARAYMAGLQESIRLKADVIVNTDADNQYNADDIEKLVAPILSGEAEIVVGARPISTIAHFSVMKRMLQKLGSSVVRRVSNTTVSDVTSGFRAMSRSAAQQINVFSDYTYTLETIIQAGQKGMAIISVPIGVNGETRPSRLVKSIASYVGRSILTIMRISITYRPLRFFVRLGGVIFLVGFLIGARFLSFYLGGDGGGHIQSLILASMLMSMGFIVVITGVLADLIAVNRKLLEQTLWRLKKLEENRDEPD